MGISANKISRTKSIVAVMVAGSPGPFDRNTPSGLRSEISLKETLNGITCVSTPRIESARGVAPLIPRSIAATVNFFAPWAATT